MAPEGGSTGEWGVFVRLQAICFRWFMEAVFGMLTSLFDRQFIGGVDVVSFLQSVLV